MAVPLLDLAAQYASIQDEVEAAVLRVLRGQRFILGPEVAAFEEEAAAAAGVPHAVGVSSGTDALIASLMALGVGPGDEVITTAFSFFATAGSIARLGARPVLVDIDPATYLMDLPAALERVGPRTRALMPVHLFGRCVDVAALAAGAPGVPVVEDAAQAIGATRPEGPAGSLGACGCFSFFPSKNLGGAGDGGLVTTRDPALAAAVRALRNHGRDPDDATRHPVVGGNFRLDALQAAVLRVKLPRLAGWNDARRENARRYRRLIAEAGLPLVPPPEEAPGCRDIYNQFVVRAPRRDDLLRHLRAHGVGCAVYYPRALHQQPCFAGLGHGPGAFPEAERAAREVLALPVYPELTGAQMDEVVGRIAAFYAG